MNIKNKIEFEVSNKEEHYIFIFQINIDTTFDKETNEIQIDIIEERLDNIL